MIDRRIYVGASLSIWPLLLGVQINSAEAKDCNQILNACIAQCKDQMQGQKQ
jgi:hypothetical protein